jgi:hydrogenase maturation protease
MVYLELNEKASPNSLLILGFGNPFMSDDGIGVLVVRSLANRNLPSHVKLFEAGTPGWGLPNILEGWKSVIMIDAVDMGQSPGAWRRFYPEQVRLIAQGETLSLHQPDLADGLALTQALGMLPESIVLYGVQLASLEFGDTISPALLAALPEMVEHVYQEIWEGKV